MLRCNLLLLIVAESHVVPSVVFRVQSCGNRCSHGFPPGIESLMQLFCLLRILLHPIMFFSYILSEVVEFKASIFKIFMQLPIAHLDYRARTSPENWIPGFLVSPLEIDRKMPEQRSLFDLASPSHKRQHTDAVKDLPFCFWSVRKFQESRIKVDPAHWRIARHTRFIFTGPGDDEGHPNSSLIVGTLSSF